MCGAGSSGNPANSEGWGFRIGPYVCVYAHATMAMVHTVGSAYKQEFRVEGVSREREEGFGRVPMARARAQESRKHPRTLTIGQSWGPPPFIYSCPLFAAFIRISSVWPWPVLCGWDSFNSVRLTPKDDMDSCVNSVSSLLSPSDWKDATRLPFLLPTDTKRA